MHPRFALLPAIALGAAVLVSACSGPSPVSFTNTSTTQTTQSSQGTGSATLSDTETSATPAPATEATATPAPATGAASTAAKAGSGTTAKAGSATAKSAAGLIDPCTLLTQQEAGEALGKSVAAGASFNTYSPLGQRECGWRATGQASYEGVYLAVIQSEGVNAALRRNGHTIAKQFAETKRIFTGQPSFQNVSDIGDEAFIAGNRLYVLQDDVSFSVVVGSPYRPNQDAAKQVAQKALERLPQQQQAQ